MREKKKSSIKNVKIYLNYHKNYLLTKSINILLTYNFKLYINLNIELNN